MRIEPKIFKYEDVHISTQEYRTQLGYHNHVQINIYHKDGRSLEFHRQRDAWSHLKIKIQNRNLLFCNAENDQETALIDLDAMILYSFIGDEWSLFQSISSEENIVTALGYRFGGAATQRVFSIDFDSEGAPILACLLEESAEIRMTVQQYLDHSKTYHNEKQILQQIIDAGFLTADSEIIFDREQLVLLASINNKTLQDGAQSFEIDLDPLDKEDEGRLICWTSINNRTEFSWIKSKIPTKEEIILAFQDSRNRALEH
jgi:hypothetical protein